MTNNPAPFELSGHIVDVVGKRIFRGTVRVEQGKIAGIREEETRESGYILPGLIDAHIHIESSMLIPSGFARMAVVHGTVATVSDPHEIANVLGIDGVRFMIANGKKVPFRFYFGAPSCVPATPFETAGAVIGPEEVEELLRLEEVHYLSEMMNFPGVLFQDEIVLRKLALARKYGKPVDGHAPGLRGEDAARYAAAGITTDHECFTREEALDKIRAGMKILIREGSAARNFEALADLIDEYPDSVMLCSDDKHPNDLRTGHINELVKRAIGRGLDTMNVLRACTLNPVRHYSLGAGLLQPGDPADLIQVDDLAGFNIQSVFINGIKVAENGKSLLEEVKEEPKNIFHASPVTAEQIAIPDKGKPVRVIRAFDGQLVTGESEAVLPSVQGQLSGSPEQDILKIVVKDRYTDAPPAVGFIHGFGLKKGAIASSVAHDSHNIIAVGAEDVSLIRAINLIIATRGGISVVGDREDLILPLPFAGIMSGENGLKVAEAYDSLDRKARELGSPLRAPFMTLSFMALLVIPELKMSDRGLFDGKNFKLTGIFAKGS